IWAQCFGGVARLGRITKQGDALLRFLLAHAAQVSPRRIPVWRRKYFRLAMRRGRKIARVRHGPHVGGADVLDVARDGLRASKKVGSHADSLEIAMVCRPTPSN